MMKKIIPITLLLIVANCSAQSFEKTFSGQWAMTSWTFEFHKDGMYKRISAGHYGNTEVQGKYTLHKDTVQLTGYEDSQGTISEKYLLQGSYLVDLTLLYDYKLNAKPWEYNSRKRYDVFPEHSFD